MINANVIVISRCASSSSNYVLVIIGSPWYYKVLNIFVTFGNSMFFSKKKNDLYKYLPSISGYEMPLVSSLANLNPHVDLQTNALRERNTIVIRSL